MAANTHKLIKGKNLENRTRVATLHHKALQSADQYQPQKKRCWRTQRTFTSEQTNKSNQPKKAKIKETHQVTSKAKL